MALGKAKSGDQIEFFFTTHEICSSADPYYKKLGDLLAASGFEAFLAEVCAEFYPKRLGRPGLSPAVYFKMLMVGYLEGLGSERRIAWSCNDSLALRTFLGYTITERTPDHSTLSKTRRRYSVEVHKQVFNWLLRRGRAVARQDAGRGFHDCRRKRGHAEHRAAGRCARL